MTWPGFTAEASVYRTANFGQATVAEARSTTERVQPAITCFDCGMYSEEFLNQNNIGMSNFWYGVAKGLGCET